MQIGKLIDDRCATSLRRLAMPGADQPADETIGHPPGATPHSDAQDG